MFTGKLDDKGRLKLPVNFQEFLKGFGEQKLFVTSLDRRLAQLYPMSVWLENEKLLEEEQEHSEEAGRIKFTANDMGADVEMDGQGRVLFNTQLRRELDLEGQDVHLLAHGGRVEVIPEAIYQELRRKEQNPTADLTVMRKRGLK
jgi:DNA-binding transcriptional regulator/RsmH inhibitor MraZ